MRIQIFLLLSLLHGFSTLIHQGNNVCKSFEDYYYPNLNKNCYYDPDTSLDTPELIKKYTGRVETHPVISDDGYIITMFRMPSKNPKGVILLHHSLATDSRIYFWQGEKSFAVTLWKNGFDVWLANQRGTTYSVKHQNMTSQNYKYWDFCAHEMGIYDASAELQYINNKTNSKATYVGHSLGSAIGLIYASLKYEEAEKYLNGMVLMGPPCYFDHATSIVTALTPFVGILENITRTYQSGSPLMILPKLRPLSNIFLRQFPFTLKLTSILIWLVCGYTPKETDPTFFNFDATIYANNFSWKTLFQFLQIAQHNHRFQQYDYGPANNLKMYNQELPPVYPLNNISVPILLISSQDDILTTTKDAETLFDDLSEKAKVFGHWKLEGLNHLDFYTGLHRNKIFVDRLIEFLGKL